LLVGRGGNGLLDATPLLGDPHKIFALVFERRIRKAANLLAAEFGDPGGELLILLHQPHALLDERVELVGWRCERACHRRIVEKVRGRFQPPSKPAQPPFPDV
jgi:hypothetical protein